MKYTLEIKEEANQEITASYLYYQEKRIGLGEEFLEQLSIYFDRITSNPKHFPQKRKPYREAFIKRFPFLIIRIKEFINCSIALSTASLN